MPRVRALFLLGLFVVNQAACTSWQVPKVTPQEYVAQHPGKGIRVAQKDALGGNTKVLWAVRFVGDSVFGQDETGQPVGYSLQQVATIEVRRVDGVLTGLLLLPIAALVFVGIALANCGEC